MFARDFEMEERESVKGIFRHDRISKIGKRDGEGGDSDETVDRGSTAAVT